MSPRAVALLAFVLVGCTRPSPTTSEVEPFETPRLPWVGEMLGPAQSVELFRLDGSVHVGEAEPKEEPKARLAGWDILVASGPLDDGAREKSKKAIQSLLASAENEVGSRCFQPHHALVAEHDGHRLEVVVCFRCDNAEFWLDGDRKKILGIGTEGREELDGLLAPAPARAERPGKADVP